MTFVRRMMFLVAVLALLVPAPARADAPARLATQVTDAAGALGSGRAEADAALGSLRRETGIQLFVVFVDSFDGTPAQEWTDETARLSDLGDRDALLAVATTDRAYAYSFPDDSRITDRELDDVAAQEIEPALSRGDWSGAVVAAATGYTDAAQGSGLSAIWVVVVLAIVLAGALIWVVARRRNRPAAAPAAPAGPTIAELTAEANALLIELDDDLRAAESELALATAQYGEAETVRFRAALEQSRQDVAEAFRLRMTLEEEPAPADDVRHRTLTEIVARCRAADDRLDAESEAFDQLRDLEGRAEQAAAEVERRRLAAEATVAGAAVALQDLQHRWAGPPVAAVAGNIDQAHERLRFAGEAAGRARAALSGPAGGAPAGGATAGGAATDGATTGGATRGGATRGGAAGGGDRAEAALALRAAEQAVGQAEQLLGAVHQAGSDLAAARTAADALIAEIADEVATAGALRSGTGLTAGVAAALESAAATAERAVAEARVRLTAARPDPVSVAAQLQAADAALDRALAAAQTEAERIGRSRVLLAQALTVARAEVAAARNFITTRRGAVGTGARTSLSEAERHLALAESLAAADPATALTHSQQAQSLAAAAGRSAGTDVQTWSGGYGGSGAHDAGSVAGAILGGLIRGAASSGRSGGWSSGSGVSWSGGGFGGSSARGRRTGGGGRSSGGGRSGGGRRGGGGRF